MRARYHASKEKHENFVEEESESEEEEEVEVEVPYTYEVEEWQDDVEETVERVVPQVKAMYPYSGQGMKMTKGEVMILLEKTNNDWWSVLKANQEKGYVPANYVKELEPKVIKKTKKVPRKVLVTKTGTKKEVIKKKKDKPVTAASLSAPSSSLRRTPSGESGSSYSTMNVIAGHFI